MRFWYVLLIITGVLDVVYAVLYFTQRRKNRASVRLKVYLRSLLALLAWTVIIIVRVLTHTTS